MRRLLVLILALLLPIAAVAETYEVSLEISANELLFEEYFKQWLGEHDGTLPEKTDLVLEIVRRVMDGASLHMVMQENAAQLEINLAGGTLLDLAFYTLGADKICLTSSMLGKTALADMRTENDSSSRLEEIDWTRVGMDLENAVVAWLENMEPTTEYGSFVGDAFDGGSQCVTWSLTDQDIAGLVSTALTEDVRSAAIIVMDEMGLDGADMLGRFERLNATVADEDVYLYILRAVSGAAGEPLGLSLTIIEEDRQVATLSLGLGEETLKLVAGFGMQNKNYWWESTVQSISQLKTLTYSGQTREWMSDKENSFSYVQAMEAPLVDNEWYFTMTDAGSRHHWNGAVYEEQPDGTRSYTFSTNGTVLADGSILSAQFALGSEQASALSLKLDFKPADEIPDLADDVVIYDATDPADADKAEQMMDQLASVLSARLMKLLPMDLIFRLNTPSIP